MRYVSYTRTTSCFAFDEIPDGVIGLQNDHITAYAKEHGISIDKKYSDRKKDAEEKAAFDRLFEDGMKREFDCVVVDSIYRAGNNLWVAKEVLLQTFYYAGIHFIVVEDDFNSTEKDYEAVEKYFAEKYSNYKSRVLGERNRRTKKKETKKVREPKTDQKRQKHVSSLIAYELYDSATEKHMNLRKINDEPVFTVATEGYPIFSDPTYRIGVKEAEEEALRSIYEEKELAARVKTRILNGEGKAILQQSLDEIGEEMKLHFYMVSSGQESMEDTEEYFLSCTERAERLEKAFSVNNPWIRKMEQLPEVMELDKRLIKKNICHFWMTDFRSIEAETLWDDWKQLLPEEWLVS